MSSDTPPGTPETPAQPFARGRIQWSRSPQPVFRVGPLPAAPRQPQQAAQGQGAGILSGSMVPPRRREPDAAPPVSAEPDLTIHPEVAPEPEPAPPPEPRPEPASRPAEVMVEALAAEPAVTVPPLAEPVRPVAEPRKLPSIVVTRARLADMGAAIQKASPKDRWVVAAAVASVVVIGGFVWLATLPAETPASTTAVPFAAEPAVDAPFADAVEPVEAPVSAAGATPGARVAAPPPRPAAPRAPVRPVARPTASPAPATPGATVVAPPVEAEAGPVPFIETAPLAVEPPTPAEAAPVDPDAPIATRPQPLN